MAIRHIDEHRDEVMADYAEMFARDATGNPPELRAKLDAAHERLQAMLRERREARWPGVRGILADINVGKQRRGIVAIWTSGTRREIWDGLGLSVVNFRTVGLPYNAPDAMIWTTCQRERLVLSTGNRNKRGPDSFEAAIQRENQPDSPVPRGVERTKPARGKGGPSQER